MVMLVLLASYFTSSLYALLVWRLLDILTVYILVTLCCVAAAGVCLRLAARFGLDMQLGGRAGTSVLLSCVFIIC